MKKVLESLLLAALLLALPGNALAQKKAAKNALEKNMPLRIISFTDEEKDVIKPFCFLTKKPIIYLANVSE